MKYKNCTVCGKRFLGDKLRMRCYGECIWGYKRYVERIKKIKMERKLEGIDFVREKIRIRDNHTCQKCGKKWEEGQRRFDVHHIDGDKNKTHKYDNLVIEALNMITLCHKCHFSLEITKNAIKIAKINC